LTWNSIDLEAGLLSIEGITKNEHSKRVLPLCKQLVAILKEAKQRKDEADRETKGRVIPMDGGPVLASPQGMAFVGNSYMNISHRVNQLLVAWKTDLPWRGKDLRKCLPSWAGSTARDGQVLESYLGHAPQGITSRHYQSALLPPSLKPRTLGEKDEHEARIKRVKNLLLEPWELAIEESRVRLADLKAKEKDGAVVALGEVAQ
jgi:integrase